MERKEYRAKRTRRVDQRIGPALRALRRREGLTLEELANRCDVSRTCVSRIEQGRRDVTLPCLMRLSAALGVDITYFASYQDESSRTENELREILADIDITPEAIPALLSLSYEAQGALLDGLRWLTVTQNTRPLHAKQLVDEILSRGVKASIAHIRSGIAKFGLDDEGFCRVITQMEELSGDRLVMSDRLLSVTASTDGPIDPTDVFRSIFQCEPDSPTLVRWWAQALRSAVRQNMERFESRTIYPVSAIRTYIDSGQWGIGVQVDTGLVRRQVTDLVETLRTKPNVKLGLIDENVPFNLLVKGEKQAMAYIRRGEDVRHGQGAGVAYRSTRTDVVRKFREYFEDLWENIPPEYKESETVARWLESRIATTAN